MIGSEIDELFNQTLSGDYEDDAPWNAVHTLRLLGTRKVFEKAAEWCEPENPLARARGASVLGQLGRTGTNPNNSFPEESYSVIARLVQRETDPQPLAAAIAALGDLDNPLAVPLCVNFLSHPSEEVRFSVVFALGCFSNDSLSAATLMQLMQDSDENIRIGPLLALAFWAILTPQKFVKPSCSVSMTLAKTCAKKPWSAWGKDEISGCSQSC